ncbi:hypothetical protein OHC33_011079, partial [Knufia fluminis]
IRRVSPPADPVLIGEVNELIGAVNGLTMDIERDPHNRSVPMKCCATNATLMEVNQSLFSIGKRVPELSHAIGLDLREFQDRKRSTNLLLRVEDINRKLESSRDLAFLQRMMESDVQKHVREVCQDANIGDFEKRRSRTESHCLNRERRRSFFSAKMLDTFQEYLHMRRNKARGIEDETHGNDVLHSPYSKGSTGKQRRMSQLEQLFEGTAIDKVLDVPPFGTSATVVESSNTRDAQHQDQASTFNSKPSPASLRLDPDPSRYWKTMLFRADYEPPSPLMSELTRRRLSSSSWDSHDQWSRGDFWNGTPEFRSCIIADVREEVIEEIEQLVLSILKSDDSNPLNELD